MHQIVARKLAASGAKVLLVDCDPVVTTRRNEPGFPKGSAFAQIKDRADSDLSWLMSVSLAQRKWSRCRMRFVGTSTWNGTSRVALANL